MAIFRIRLKSGKLGVGYAHFSYITRTGNYKNAKEVEDLISCESGNLPSWAKGDPDFFWKCVDEYEKPKGTSLKRKKVDGIVLEVEEPRGSAYREFEITLPRELNDEQLKESVEAWCKKELNGYPFTYAIHKPDALDGEPQPHAHIMFCERKADGKEYEPEVFFKRNGCKKKALTLVGYREKLAVLQRRRSENVGKFIAMPT